MVEAWELMESASHFLAPACPSLFFSVSKWEQGGAAVYGEAYYSQVLSKAMVVDGLWVNCLEVRRQFATLWTDYLAKAEFGPNDTTMVIMREGAAALMGNSSKVWDRNYDNKARERAYSRIIAHYPKFKEFVAEGHANELAMVPRNPITGQLG